MRTLVSRLLPLLCCLPLPLLAQISKPTEEELQAAPPQFQGLVHGKTDKIDQSKPPRPPGPAPLPSIPNPSHDAHDLSGYWVMEGGPRGFDQGGGYPGGGPGSGDADLRVGDRYHSEIDANRMCLVMIGVNPTTMKVYQTPKQLTMVYANSLHARRIYFSTTHTPHARPSYNGDSIAKWDGDTLVIDTIAVKGLISLLGADLEKGVHTLLLARPTLHVVERISRSADGEHLTDEASWSDSSAPNAAAVTRTAHFTYSAETPSWDWECEDIGDRFGPQYGGGAQ